MAAEVGQSLQISKFLALFYIILFFNTVINKFLHIFTINIRILFQNIIFSKSFKKYFSKNYESYSSTNSIKDVKDRGVEVTCFQKLCGKK